MWFGSLLVTWAPPSRNGGVMERGDWPRLRLIKGLRSGQEAPCRKATPNWVFSPFTGLCDKKGWLDWKLCGRRWIDFTWLCITCNQKLISPFATSLFFTCSFVLKPLNSFKVIFWRVPYTIHEMLSNQYCWRHYRFVCLPCIEFLKDSSEKLGFINGDRRTCSTW